MMSMECHVTVKCAASEVQHLQDLIESAGWSFSQITNDPLLGAHTFCYATNHYETLAHAIQYTLAMSEALQIAEFRVLRRKVEQIMMDERYHFEQEVWRTV